jgi:hypothetical protein
MSLTDGLNNEGIFATETVLKGNLYTRIKELLVLGGWQNISSNPATDYDIFYSTGVNADKELYFQLSDNSSYSAGTKNHLYFKMIGKYTPGAPGVAGVFDSNRSADIYCPFYPIYATAVQISSANIPLKISYTVNKDRMILVTEAPLAMGLQGNVVYFGAMTIYESSPRGRALVFACASQDSSRGYLVINSPYSDSVLSYSGAAYGIAPPKEYNNDDIRMLNEIAVGTATEGLRGKLSGLYVVYVNATNSRTTEGDILTDGTTKYRVIRFGNNGNLASQIVPQSTYYYAIRIE